MIFVRLRFTLLLYIAVCSGYMMQTKRFFYFFPCQMLEYLKISRREIFALAGKAQKNLDSQFDVLIFPLKILPHNPCQIARFHVSIVTCFLGLTYFLFENIVSLFSHLSCVIKMKILQST